MPSEILPFKTDETHLHESMGPIHEIVSLADNEHTEGRCPRCGYDRGERSAHTEVEAVTIECGHCEYVLFHRD